MNTIHDRRDATSDTARRLRSLTIGTAFLGVVATGALSALAATTNDGSDIGASTVVTTAAVSTAAPPPATTPATPPASATTTSTSSSTSSTSGVSATRGTGNASTGRS